MGAQAAALLDGGGAIGDVPAAAAEVGRLQLRRPAGYDLDRVARAHGGVGLAPSAWDGTCLHRVLPGGVPVVVAPDLRVSWSVPADAHVVRRTLTDVLCLDDDLTGLHDACDRVPALAWVRPAGAGRVLRAPTAFEDLSGVLAATNTSYAATRRMVGALVRSAAGGVRGGGAFPTPQDVLGLGEAGLRAAGWGYRAPALVALARRADELEDWRDPAVPDEQVLAGLHSLAGFGPFAAATALPLMGHRPRPLVLDAWLRRQVGDPSSFAPMGRWAGSGVWLTVTRHRHSSGAPGGGLDRRPS